MSDDFEVTGTNDAALFSLKLHRGEGMLLLAMNWKRGLPPDDFAGFAIEYQEPGGGRFFTLNNRLSFTPGTSSVHPSQRNPTRTCPIQKFRWVDFPRRADLPGLFTYRVTPVFMDGSRRTTTSSCTASPTGGWADSISRRPAAIPSRSTRRS